MKLNWTINKAIWRTLNLKQKILTVWGCFLANAGYLK